MRVARTWSMSCDAHAKWKYGQMATAPCAADHGAGWSCVMHVARFTSEISAAATRTSMPEELMNNPEALAALQQACPQCVIYQHDGLCLGPGWLVLFLPPLLLVLVHKRRKARIQA